MQVTENTKISVLIKENSAVIEAIASINKHFEKLKNPILRKILASRVTIKDAAKIGGTDIQAFFDKLSPLGFYCESDTKLTTEEKQIIPGFYKTLTKKKTLELDVREDLKHGKDPFNKIMDTLAQMPEEFTLKLINTFEPIPLIKLLSKKGYSSYVVNSGPSLILTYIKYTDEKSSKQAESLISYARNKEQMDEIVRPFGEKVKTIDVRELEAPLPMTTILNELELLPKDTLLYVNHKKVPQFLLPELNERNYSCMILEVGEGDVKLLIYK